MTSILFSIIIPNFNRSKIILETLKSVKEQTFKNWECIIIDDGSTDNSLEIIKKFIKDEARFILKKRDCKPKGAPVCRNIGAKLSKSNLLLFLDSDDILAPWCLEDRFNKITKSELLDFYLFPCASFSNNNLSNIQIIFPNKNDNILLNYLTLSNTYQTSSPIWNKAFFEKLLFDEKLPCWQDTDIHMRSLFESKNFKVFHTLPDVFIRKDQSVRISNNLSTELAEIQLYYSWKKPIPFMTEKEKKIFLNSYLINMVYYIELAPKDIAIELVDISIKSDFFTKKQGFILNIYTRSYHFFKENNIPNIPYRLKQFLGINKKNNTLNNKLNKNEMDNLRNKLSQYKTSILYKQFLTN